MTRIILKGLMIALAVNVNAFGATPLSQEEIDKSINELAAFEASPQIDEARAVSELIDRQSGQAKANGTISAPQVDRETRRQAKWLKKEKMLVEVAFLNQAGYPSKSRRGVYYSQVTADGSIADQAFAEQWDAVIVNDLFAGRDFSPRIDSVSSTVVLTFFWVVGADELREFLAGKQIMSLRHVASPKPKDSFHSSNN